MLIVFGLHAHKCVGGSRGRWYLGRVAMLPPVFLDELEREGQVKGSQGTLVLLVITGNIDPSTELYRKLMHICNVMSRVVVVEQHEMFTSEFLEVFMAEDQSSGNLVVDPFAEKLSRHGKTKESFVGIRSADTFVAMVMRGQLLLRSPKGECIDHDCTASMRKVAEELEVTAQTSELIRIW